eukprot:3309649-Rhodomonas_salina.2
MVRLGERTSERAARASEEEGGGTVPLSSYAFATQCPLLTLPARRMLGWLRKWQRGWRYATGRCPCYAVPDTDILYRDTPALY